MIACEFLLFFLSIFSLSLIILHPREIIDFIAISKLLNLRGSTGENYDGIKIKNGRTRKWAGKNFRRRGEGEEVPSVSRGGRGETQSRSLVVYLKISLMHVRRSRDTPSPLPLFLTVHAYWAIPRHECRHKLPERDALHRFHVLPAPVELVHREPTQLLGYRSLAISKEIPDQLAQCEPGHENFSLFSLPLSSSSPLHETCRPATRSSPTPFIR